MIKESENIELKESLTQLKLGIKSVVSILNKHKKGKVIFGVKDNGVAIGVSIGKDTLRNISKAIFDNIEPKIYPEIKEEIIDGKKCVVVHFTGKEAPYFAYGRAYMRVTDEDRLISTSELEKLFLDRKKNKYHWDKDICSKAKQLDISDEKLKKYAKEAGLEYTSKKEILESLELIDNDLLTNASIILFGKKPSQFFKLLNLRCATFIGESTASKPIDMTEFNGDLFELIVQAENYILQHINVGMKLDGLKRIDIPEINKDAFREAIINAFCHRDYSIPQEITVSVFNDRIEIQNPGELISGLTIEDILTKKVSKRRNPLIADIFHRVRLVEKWGTGIKKIKSLEPNAKFEVFGGFFNATFTRHQKPKTGMAKFRITKSELRNKNLPKQALIDYLGKGWEKVGKRLGINQLKIVVIVSANHNITIEELSEELQISTTAIENNIRKLKEEGILKRTGGRKEGSWEVQER